MNTLKTLALLLAMLLAMPMLTACHDDDDNEVETPVVGGVNPAYLVGTWECTSLDVDGKDKRMNGCTLTFNADSTYTTTLGYAAYFYGGGTYTFMAKRLLKLTSADQQFIIYIDIDRLDTRSFNWSGFVEGVSGKINATFIKR